MLIRKLSLFLLSSLFALSLHAQPQLSRIAVAKEGTATLSGRGFGPPCQKCEVIVNYGKGLKYAVPILQWKDRHIEIELPDLNLGINLSAVVKTPDGSSAEKPFQLKRQITPGKELTKTVKNRADRTLMLFEKTHKGRLGGKGEDQFKLSVNPLSCDRKSKVFEKARLVYGDSRFAEAQITALPAPGCIRCQPLKVGWYHEPTGRLTYQLHIYRRVVEGICQDRIRR